MVYRRSRYPDTDSGLRRHVDEMIGRPRQGNIQPRVVSIGVCVLKNGNLRKEKSVVRKHLAYLLDAESHLAVEIVVAHHTQHMSSPDRAFGRQDDSATPWTSQDKSFLRKPAVGRAHYDLAYAQMPRQLRHRRQHVFGLVEPRMDCIAQTIRQLISETIAA